LREGGAVLAEETNKAFDAISSDSDWPFISGRWVGSWKILGEINASMINIRTLRMWSLLFKYLHFYGNYKYTGDSRKWYRHEIRIIRNDKKNQIFSGMHRGSEKTENDEGKNPLMLKSIIMAG